MYFPKLSYSIKKKLKKFGGFSGLNRTENFKEGQLRDSLGLTTENYPTLTQSKPFATYSDESGITDMYEHNGRLLLVYANGNVTFDGKAMGIISPGRKQFATVNTRLCIFPDKVYIDMNTDELKQMEASVVGKVEDDNISFTSSSISATAYPDIWSTEKVQNPSTFERQNNADDPTYNIYTYKTDKDVITQCWDGEKWSGLETFQKTKQLAPNWSYTDDAIGGRYEYSADFPQVGDIFIPKYDDESYATAFAMVYSRGNETVDTSLYNNNGFYGVITGVYHDQADRDSELAVYTYDFTVYDANNGAPLFSDVFAVGDRISIKGSPLSLYDIKDTEILSFDNTTNTIGFAEETFLQPKQYVVTERDIIAGVKTWFDNGYRQWAILPKSTISSGTLLFTTEDGEDLKNIYEWDRENLCVKNTYAVVDENMGDSNEMYHQLGHYSLGNAEIKIQRDIPDLDYICESENRLWGVSNKNHTIYASALGLPWRFSDYETVSTDSYAVAVASEDDFTAICAYGGGVCCFKENRLHKMLGSYPAEYYMNEYEIAGVQKGSERSLQIINEVLYYKGTNGIYAYSGGVPSLISRELGNVTSKASAAVAHGLNYYISLGDGIYVYDKLHGLWMKQTKAAADTMVNVGGTVVTLQDGVLYGNTGSTDDAMWRVELTPFESDTEIKRCYGKVIIRMDMSQDAVLQMYVREDNKKLKKIYSHRSPRETSIEVPLPIGRCDRFSIVLEGKGKVTLRSIAVEYI